MFRTAYRWLWLRLNKKPPKPWESYIGLLCPWVYAGMFGGLAILLLSAVISDKTIVSGRWSGIGVGVLTLFLAAYMGYIGYKGDCERGIYKAINQAHIEHWHKKRKEYGVETEEVEN